MNLKNNKTVEYILSTIDELKSIIEPYQEKIQRVLYGLLALGCATLFVLVFNHEQASLSKDWPVLIVLIIAFSACCAGAGFTNDEVRTNLTSEENEN